jgi:hypothetical protein
VVFELLNDRNMVISRQTLRGTGNWGRQTLDFQNIRANDITDTLSIRVASVNGTDAMTAARNGVIQIRAIPRSEFDIYSRFSVSRGRINSIEDVGNNNLIIPSTIWGEPVTGIIADSFAPNRTTLTNITIGPTVNIEACSWIRNNFREFYIQNNMRAGTYSLSGSTWIYSPTQ